MNTFTPIELMWLHPMVLNLLKDNWVMSIEYIIDNPSCIDVLSEEYKKDMVNTLLMRWINLDSK